MEKIIICLIKTFEKQSEGGSQNLRMEYRIWGELQQRVRKCKKESSRPEIYSNWDEKHIRRNQQQIS